MGMKKSSLLFLLVLALILGGIFGGKAWLERRAAAAAASQGWPAATVATAVAREARWDARMQAVGTLRALEGTQITAQIAGNVVMIGFESGRAVKKGELLVQLDDSTQQAQLRSDEAQLQQARLDLERMEKLFASRAVSQRELQDAQMRHSVAAAAVDSDRATLAKLRITAPFSGVLGIRQVSVGQYVSPGTAIVDLQRWKPLLLDFTLPQNLLSQLRVGQEVAFRVDAFPGSSFAGKVSALGAQIDPDTRNVPVQARLDNADERLRPGLFGHVSLGLGEATSGVAVPQTAISYSTFGDTVFVVQEAADGGRSVQARVVHVLAERDGEVLLDAKQLAAGSEVVTAGQNKLRDGAAVKVDNSVKP